VSQPASGFTRALAALREAGVEFVIVGVGGINFYARTPGEVFATVDLDTLLRPAVENLATALRVLSGIGYTFEAGGEPFLDLEDIGVLSRVVSRGAALTAIHPDEGQLDLMTSMAGFSYDELLNEATTFRVADVEVRVGQLEKLLRSKERSGRPKDLEFLRAFEARAVEEGED
jgi:predicted nucleotidyltransferase